MKSHLIIIGLTLALIAPVFAQQKVSERTSLAAAALAPATDILPIVDISAGLSGSKKITIDDLFTGWGMTTAGATLSKAANATAQRTALGLGTAATAASTAFEPALGNPAADGYVLSSTAAGVRTWIAGGGGGAGDIADETDIEVGTDNTKLMTPLRTHQTLAYFGLTPGSGGYANFPTGITAFDVVATELAAEDLNVSESTTLTGDITLALPGSATGDTYFRNSTGKIERLPIGTAGQILKVDSGLPVWGAAAGGGGDLLAANNLSDLANVATARTNLGLGIGSNVQAWDADLSSWAGVTRASGFDAFSATPSSANLASLVTNELGYGNVLFGDQAVDSFSHVNFATVTTSNDAVFNGNVIIEGNLSATINSLTNWSGSGVFSTPNNVVYASVLSPSVASTNGDAVISPKGTGSLLANLPDNTATGGNKRGANAVDWQTIRTAATHVSSGAQATISGGSRNTASGTASVVSGGLLNIASATRATVAGGSTNTASGEDAFVAGDSNTASGADSFAVGLSNTATGARSMSMGQSNVNSGGATLVTGGGNTATHNQAFVMGQNAVSRIQQGFYQAAGSLVNNGDAQVGRVVLRRSTSSATTASLETTSGGGVQEITLPNNSTYSFTGQISARSSVGDSAAWRFAGTIERGANAAATTLIGTPTISDTNAEAGASTWTVAIVADTAGGALRINVTGAAATNIRWVAQVETAEIVY